MPKHIYIVFSCILLCVSGSWSQDVESRVVTLAQGPVRGYIDPNMDIFAFHGIPYAKAPTGTDKFKAPLPPQEWTEIFEATNANIVCPQSRFSVLDMREDCLIANIFTPNTTETNLPVLVVVHGGGYQFGFGNQLIPRTLVNSQQIIAVTFNYRLGAHGFLCLGTNAAPGNAGMKDQVALLRWVKENIASFGGNPDDVTIAGCSAGGGSVDLLTLSPLTNGLFNKAITESGACVGSVGVQIDPIENARIYAGVLGFPNVDDRAALVDSYTTASMELLTSRSDVVTNRHNGAVLFGPCLERDTDETPFLQTSPISILSSGEYNKIPVYYGFANMEGLIRIDFFNTWKDLMNERFSDFLPADLQFENEDEREEVAGVVKNFYFGDEPVGESTILEFINYFTDILFGFPMLRTLKLRIESNGDTMYLYEYSFVDENTPLVPFTNVRGADHCDQHMAVIREEEDISDEFRNMKAKTRELWLNFILTGNPVSQGSNITSWPAALSDRSPHLSLGVDVDLKGILLEERAAFWDDIYERHFRAPQPPNGASNILISNTCILLAIVSFFIRNLIL